MITHWFAVGNIGIFFTAALILAITPGPGIMYVMARTLSGGRSDGIASTFGTAVGGLVHVGLAAAGLSALLAASARAFLVIKYVGAAYLVYLGLRSLLQARRVRMPLGLPPPVRSAQAFNEGVLTEALNVKTALFFLSFIPQFINHALPAASQFAVLGLICVGLNTSVDFLVVLLAARLSGYFRNSPKRAQAVSYGSGTVLLGLGAYVALSEG